MDRLFRWEAMIHLFATNTLWLLRLPDFARSVGLGVFGLLLLNVSLLQAQDISFQHLTTKDGLSSNDVTAVVQDRQGNIWIGTVAGEEGGLHRYDGHDMMVYKHIPDNSKSISNLDVWVLSEDRQGMIWIGTWEDGLTRLDPQTETLTHYRHGPDNPNSLSHDKVRAIHEDRQGKLWVGTQGGGLRAYPKTPVALSVM